MKEERGEGRKEGEKGGKGERREEGRKERGGKEVVL